MICNQLIPLSCGFGRVCLDSGVCAPLQSHELYLSPCNADRFCGVLKCHELLCSECRNGDIIDQYMCQGGKMVLQSRFIGLGVIAIIGWLVTAGAFMLRSHKK
ncbi:hypothetical protein SS50377_24102 [Spironucleus salmonicida]|uniref:Uncharacterized protein n=1 Tax=Spironucleus salmonicida TaxID=348837 RepID=V6LHT5_9EUKA|nr:hypothetical protein SS50377_24102 [Spironucleus salmonicida]|eukprot:EST44117.1 hypothetical protein SS50377_16117 [Spironucleus salmonicida]